MIILMTVINDADKVKQLSHKFRFLSYGLGLVLVFVGLKMAWLNEAFGGQLPILWSLGIIAGLLGAALAATLLIPPRRPTTPDAANAR